MMKQNLTERIKKYKGPILTMIAGGCIMFSSTYYMHRGMTALQKEMTDQVKRVYEIKTELNQSYDLEKIVDPEYVNKMRKLVEEKKSLEITSGYEQEHQAYEKQRNKTFYGSLGLLGLGTIIFWTGSRWQSRIRRKESWLYQSNESSKSA